MSQGKVICFYTRKEVTQTPYTKEDGEAMIEQLIRMELDKPAGGPTQTIINDTIAFIENNSGASRFDVMERIYQGSVRRVGR